MAGWADSATKSVAGQATAADASKSPAVRRLMKDLRVLTRNPIAGASAAPLGDNILIWHANVAAPQGTRYEGTLLHFVLEFPGDYPVTPPHAFFVSPIEYYGGARVTDSKGRIAVCLDLFGNFKQIHSEWGKDGQASGWSSSYDVSTILVNMQAMLCSDGYLATDAAATERARRASAELTCPCGHRGGSPDTYWPAVPTESGCDAEAVAAAARPEAGVVCYATRATLADDDAARFGYGVAVERRGLTSPCEYLSFDGWESGVRTSTRNAPIDAHLPVFLTPAHWERVRDAFAASVAVLHKRLQRPAAPPGVMVLDTLASLMNNLVVQVMDAADPAASDRFIDAYFACHRALSDTARRLPELAAAADERVGRFLDSAGNRGKDRCPNLGEFLIFLLASRRFGWGEAGAAVAGESDLRNVFWYVEGNRAQPGAHPELAAVDGVSAERRCAATFAATAVSRRLMCFQVRFLQIVAAGGGGLTAELDARAGAVPAAVKAEIKDASRAVAAMRGWREHRAWLGLPYDGDDARAAQLIDAVRGSAARGYHGRGRGGGKGKGGKGYGGRR